MTDHSEFPWGPQYEPGLLTPFGVIGWLVAAILLLFLFGRAWQGAGGKANDKALENTYKIIEAFAKHARKQQYFGSPAAAHMLREALLKLLGGVQALGAALTTQIEALNTALGVPNPHGHGHGHGNGHGAGGGNNHGAGHGAAPVGQAHNQHTAHQGHAAQASDVPGAVANTVQGHSITVNIGGKPGDPGHGGPDDEHADGSVGLPQQLIAIETQIRAFEEWWSNKPVRMAELRAAQTDLTTFRKVQLPDDGKTPPR